MQKQGDNSNNRVLSCIKETKTRYCKKKFTEYL